MNTTGSTLQSPTMSSEDTDDLAAQAVMPEGESPSKVSSNVKRFPVIEIFGPVIQGEGSQAGQQTMFVRFGGCLAEESRVLMADWTYKPISRLLPGDIVLAADAGHRGSYINPEKRPPDKTTTRLVPSRVLEVIDMGVGETVEVATSVGKLRCTPDHELYSYKGRDTNGKWRAASDVMGTKLRHVTIQEWSQQYSLGWLHGAFAGDGSIHKFQDAYWRMKLCCQDPEVASKALEILQAIGAPNPHGIMHDPGNGKPLLPGVEVTNHEWVDSFRGKWLQGDTSLEYMRGWLAGFYDTDGSWSSTAQKALEGSGQIWYWQNSIVNEWKYQRCLDYLTACGFTYKTYDREDKTGKGSVGNKGIHVNKTIAFFTSCPGVLRRKQPDSLNIQWLPKVAVEGVRPVGDCHVWDIQTEHGNFIAEGMLVHNCDYRCSACDSLHAVIPRAVQKHATYMTAEEIFTKLQTVREETGIQWVTFSGGNPCMHQLGPLVDMLRDAEWLINVETQGTLWQDWLLDCSLITVSPKSMGMGEKFEQGKFEAFLLKLNGIRPLCVKVVVFSAQDFEFALHIKSLVEDIYTNRLRHNYLSAAHGGVAYYLSLGNTYPPVLDDALNLVDNGDLWGTQNHAQVLLKSYRGLSEEVLLDPRLKDFRFLPQLHVLVYGNESER